MSALEAMAAGRPVVCGAVGGLQSAVVDGRTGPLVPPDDPQALAHALARLLDDDGLHVRLGQAGPTRIAEQMVEAYQRLYHDVMREWDERPGGRAPAPKYSGS